MRALIILIAILGVGLTVACGGDDDNGPGTSLSPVGTKSGAPTATPETTANNGIAPDPAEPTLDDALTLITSGAEPFDLGPGETHAFDPQAILTDAGSATECAAGYQFDFTWQVQAPYPPDGVVLQWTIDRNGAPIKVAEAPSGEQSVGCDVVTAVNNGPDAISVAMKYAIGGR